MMPQADHRPSVDAALQALFEAEGLELLGVADAAPDPAREARYRDWIASGRHGTMDWLARHVHAKYQPERLLPGCRSVLVTGLSYYQEGEPKPGEGRVARYAWGRDYHKVLGKRLKRLAAALAAHWPDERFRGYTDSGPLDERAFAEQGGAGFVGRNTLLISSRFGSWFVLGEILSTKAWSATPAIGQPHGACPSGCRKCLDVCPTGALEAPGLMDARRCISYLTIEHKGPIPEPLRKPMGDWIFGCDLCQAVCPFQLRKRPTEEADFLAWRAGPGIGLARLLDMDEAAFRDVFAGSPVVRAGLRAMQRNACIAAGNTRDAAALPALRRLAAGEDPLLREHAQWALDAFEGDPRRGSMRIVLITAVLLAAGWTGGGCATATKLASVTEDHTIRLVSRPVSAPAELAWRVRTFSSVSASRARVRYRRFPRLARELPVPELEPFDSVPANPAIAAAVARYGKAPVPGRVDFLIGGDAVFPLLETDLAAATNRIDIQTYIFDNDVYALAFADLLRVRDAAGASVRILLDPIGTRRAWVVHPPEAPDPPRGGRLNTIRHLRRGSAIRVRRTPNLWLSSDHVKFITIDGRVAYLGGMNIGWEYRYAWRDMMSHLTGPVVHALEDAFDSAWRRAGWLGEFELLRRARRQPRLHAAEPPYAELHFLITTPWRHRYFRAMLTAIDGATHRVYVETPYLWNQQVLLALCKARHRGVDVRVVIPMETNIAFARGADRVTANTLLRHGVRVFLYPGMTHKKATVIDDWAFWGSANKDDLSLHKNMELNLATADGPTVTALERILLDGQDAATEVLDFIPTGAWDRLTSRLADLL